LAGAAQAIRGMRGLGFSVVMVTNQSGIGRGLFTLEQYERVHEEVLRQLEAAGAALDDAYFCPDDPDLEDGTRVTCRKPSEFMYRAAQAELGIDLRRSYYVGDKVTDVTPADLFGGVGILVRTGKGLVAEPEVGAHHRVVDNLEGAYELIRGLERPDPHR
ncbi:MAG: D-glycero-alpha-D-manno-heptose-1,7-bisphosphate 7-phosphatase, partial [Longimicrobiales bacterium]